MKGRQRETKGQTEKYTLRPFKAKVYLLAKQKKNQYHLYCGFPNWWLKLRKYIFRPCYSSYSRIISFFNPWKMSFLDLFSNKKGGLDTGPPFPQLVIPTLCVMRFWRHVSCAKGINQFIHLSTYQGP